MKTHFVYDPEVNGFAEYETQEEALKAASERINDYLDISDGWSEEVRQVVVGTITHRATKTNVCKKVGEVDEDGCDESGQEWLSEFDETCDYEMLPVHGVNT
jgi:hypothetical protein